METLQGSTTVITRKLCVVTVAGEEGRGDCWHTAHWPTLQMKMRIDFDVMQLKWFITVLTFTVGTDMFNFLFHKMNQGQQLLLSSFVWQYKKLVNVFNTNRQRKSQLSNQYFLLFMDQGITQKRKPLPATWLTEAQWLRGALLLLSQRSVTWFPLRCEIVL